MKICLIYNFAQHYRANIFTKIDEELDCDFVFGDKYLDIKKMNYSLIKRGNVTEVKNKRFGPVDYQEGVLSLYGKYDNFIILGEPMCVSTWLMLLKAKFNRKKRIFLWTHGWYGKETWMKKIIKKVFFKLADGVLLYGNYAKELMVKEGFDENKLKVIHNSLAYDNQLEVRKRTMKTFVYTEHFKNDNPNLVFIGRLTAIKRLDLVLDAIEILKKKGVNCNLTFIGSGVEEENLKKCTKKLGLEDVVWFYGACYDEGVNAELIYNADLCVSPGNVGLTSIHSMMFGCPVITHNNFPYQMPEFEAICKGVTGDFFEHNNVRSIADCIEHWFSSVDRETVRKACMNEIDNSWNPDYQIKVIKDILC